MATAKRARSTKSAPRKNTKSNARKNTPRKTAANALAVRRPARKTTAKKAAKKVVKRLPAASKSATPKRVMPGKPTSRKRVVAKKKTATSAARKMPKPQASVASSKVKARTTKPTRAPARELSAQAKKKLAVKHLWELVEEKKRRAAQPPPWQTIAHHDHPSPAVAHIDTPEQNQAPVSLEMPGHRERGGK